MLEKIRYRSKARLRKLVGKKQSDDDFDWTLYPQHYRGELDNLTRTNRLVLRPGDYTFSASRLERTGSDLPLHPNHRLLYETILQLAPESALELGCGGGDHLHNLQVLAPSMRLYGRELAEGQLQTLRQRHPDLRADIVQEDCTLPRPVASPQADLAYTQAVLMHLQTGKNHLVALANLFNYARRFVVLMENWTRHDFKSDIESLSKKGIIEWPSPRFYYRLSPELDRPHIMVVSKERLDYPELTDYSMLRSTAQPRIRERVRRLLPQG